MALTVKGQPITAQQSQVAAAAIQTGKNLSAPATALEACIYAGMGESSLGADSGAINNVWRANNPSNYGPAPNWSQMAAAFYNGTGDFRSGGAINNANAGHPVWQIANEVESNKVWNDSHGDSYAHQWPGGYPQALAEAQAIVKANGGSVTAGGTAGTGGTGTTGNIVPASSWTVGDAAHPDQDYYSTISQYGMAAQWYVFSNGEQLIAADGYRLIAQRPAAIISRFDPATIYARAIWDNTAWLYTATHRRRGHTQRRTSLAKLQSPTGVTLRIVCDIDAFAQGDVVQLAADFKPADGPWLIGDVTRAIYQPYSELTLVKAMTPLNAATGTAQVSQATPGTGSVINAMISRAATINNQHYPYVWGGGHAQVGIPSGTPPGYDCSGAVASVLAAGGLWPDASSVPSNDGVIQQLQSQGYAVPGQGTGQPECTLFNLPGTHIFMRLNGKYWGTSDGDGGSTGGQWLNDSHSDVNIARPYHIPASILGQTGAATGPIPTTTSGSATEPTAISMPLPSRDYGSSRAPSSITLIVLHDSEIANTPGSTADLTTLFNVLDGEGLSVHIGIDGDGNVARLVDDQFECFHVVSYNPISLGIEQIGFATQTTWPSAQLLKTAQQVAYWSKQYGIPLTFSTSHGVCQHKDLGTSGGGHSDCGPAYPFDTVLAMARNFR